MELCNDIINSVLGHSKQLDDLKKLAKRQSKKYYYGSEIFVVIMIFLYII